MRNDYQYSDPDYVYTDPKTGVLRNLTNINDHNALVFAETAATTKRAYELKTNPIKVENSNTLFTIHKHLFQDIYDWAGKRRTVEISKSGKPFFPLSRFDTALSYIDGLIAGYKRADGNDKNKLSRELAKILDAVNYLHPFREGNGRAQREFLRLLAAEKGWKLSLSSLDNAEVYEHYMNGTINGDVELLVSLISECLENSGIQR